jgi:hypothetical protein
MRGIKSIGTAQICSCRQMIKDSARGLLQSEHTTRNYADAFSAAPREAERECCGSWEAATEP